MAPCLWEVQIDTGILLLNQCLFLLLVFWLDFVYSFPAKILFTLETLKLKAQGTPLPLGMRIKKIIVCVCTHLIPAPTVLRSPRRHFIEFALQGAYGAGVSRHSCPLPNTLTRRSSQIFPYILSTS